jgi:hypothetical protein
VHEFYDQCQPLVDETLKAVDALLARHSLAEPGFSSSESGRLDAVYVAGGGSELPLVPRGLRERFGRRVRRSAHARSTTAIGLAIQADGAAGYTVRDRLTRHFGVWREKDEGASVTFDPLFSKGTLLPGPSDDPLMVQRSYAPAHDIGHFRYLECSHLSDQGQPTGEMTLWDEILFPFDPGLQSQEDLRSRCVSRSEVASRQQIEESYTCNSGGTLAVTITNQSAGYQRRYQLGRWGGEERVQPGARGKRRAKTAHR